MESKESIEKKVWKSQEPVDEHINEQVYRLVRNWIFEQVRKQVHEQVEERVRGQVWDQIGEKTLNQTWEREQQIKNAIRGQIIEDIKNGK